MVLLLVVAMTYVCLVWEDKGERDKGKMRVMTSGEGNKNTCDNSGVQSNANQTTQNYSNLGYSFNLSDQVLTNHYFTGHAYFIPEEIEVFNLT
jgi:hypothetical protein